MIRRNLESIWEKIEKSAIRSGRKRDDITLVAVSKTFPVEYIIEAYKAGQTIFGENRVKEALQKIERLKETDIKPVFHLIGHLQTNKIRYLKNNFDLIHSVDRIELVNELEKRGGKDGFNFNVLIQVNIAREPQKSGVLMENYEKLVERILSCKHICLKGLMMIPPLEDNPENNRKYFVEMRKLFENLKKDVSGVEFLSMGMSDDFEIAIEEGSNMVRIGSAIFGERKR